MGMKEEMSRMVGMFRPEKKMKKRKQKKRGEEKEEFGTQEI